MDRATHVATGIQGLTFSIGRDGVWLNTSANGLHTSINLSNVGKEGGIVNRGLLEWCKEIAAKYRTEEAKP